MRRLFAVILTLAIILNLIGCNKVEEKDNNSSSKSEIANAETSSTATQSNTLSKDNEVFSLAESSQNSGQNDLDNNYGANNIINETVKIDSLHKLNFYAVKKAIEEDNIASQTALAQTPVANITENSSFTITMYCYFTITIHDSRGFLAQKLGGTGSVEVVITCNNFNNMITFKKGERYYSCLQTSSTENAISFSSHKYVDGFNLVENYDQENYEYTVYLKNDRVIGMNCGRFQGNENYKYVADDIKYNTGFSFLIYKKQSFTVEQLQNLFALNNSFVDDGIVLNDGTILFGESSVTDNLIAFKTGSGATVITNKHIKKLSAMYNDKYNFCIKLELASSVNISDKALLNLYINNSKDRELTLQKDSSVVYITDLNNKSRMSDVFYKLTSINTNNRIGRIITNDDFLREASKRLNLNNYTVFKEDHSSHFSNGYKSVDYTYDLKTDKSISYKESNYDITIDGITITMPIKVSDFLSKGFTVEWDTFDDNILMGGAMFTSPCGNTLIAFIMNFYGTSSNINDCYITQVSFHCYEQTFEYQEGISPTRPDFEMLEGINKDSTVDDIISRLGEPNKIILLTDGNSNYNWENCIVQLFYKMHTPSLPNGELVFNLQPVLNNAAPSDFLKSAYFSLQ